MSILDPSEVAPLADMFRDYWLLHRRRFADTLAVLLKHRTPGNGSRLLDLGVFPGFLAKLAGNRGFSVSGVSNEEMTREFRSFAAANGMALSQCDVERDRLPFDENQFAVVLFAEVIEHLHRNPYHPLSEAYRVLQPGGLLVVTTPNLCRWGVIERLLHGKSFNPNLAGDFYESFPVNPNYKHCREYTASELVHLLAQQSKYLYKYTIEGRYHSRCWDSTFRDVLGSVRRLDAPFKGLLAWLLPFLVPRFRSDVMVVGRKPRFSLFVASSMLEDVSGFHDIEEDVEVASSHRRKLDAPFRWTTSHASFTLRLPSQAPASGVRLRLRIGCLAPPEAGPIDVEIAVNGEIAKRHRAEPSKAYTTLDFPIGASALRSGSLSLDIKSSTWKPAGFGLRDDRELGIMLSWGDLLLYAQ